MERLSPEFRGRQIEAPHTGITERLHRTLLDEHFRVEGRRTWFDTVEEMQAVPAQAFVEGLPKPQQQKEDKRTDKKSTKQAA